MGLADGLGLRDILSGNTGIHPLNWFPHSNRLDRFTFCFYNKINPTFVNAFVILRYLTLLLIFWGILEVNIFLVQINSSY